MAADPGVRKTVIVLLVLVALVLAATWLRQIWLADDPSSDGSPTLKQDGVLVFPEPQPIDAFTLIDQNGRPVSRSDLKGQWTLAFLGYSHCETAQCAATLETLGRFAAEVATTSAVPAFWFVSVDPQRDDPDTLRDYLQSLEFDARGLTGEPQALQSLAASLKGAFNRATQADTETGSDLEFSNHVGLIAPDASLVAIAQQPLDSQTLAGAYRRLVAWHEGR